MLEAKRRCFYVVDMFGAAGGFQRAGMSTGSIWIPFWYEIPVSEILIRFRKQATKYPGVARRGLL